MDVYFLYLFCPSTTIRRFQPFIKRFQCKTDEKVSSRRRTKIFKTQFLPRTVSLENYRVHWVVFTSTVKNLAFISIADDRPILSLVYTVWSKRKVFVRFGNLVKCYSPIYYLRKVSINWARRRVSQFKGFRFSLVDCSRIPWISFPTVKNQSIKQIKRIDQSMTSNNSVSKKLGI